MIYNIIYTTCRYWDGGILLYTSLTWNLQIKIKEIRWVWMWRMQVILLNKTWAYLVQLEPTINRQWCAYQTLLYIRDKPCLLFLSWYCCTVTWLLLWPCVCMHIMIHARSIHKIKFYSIRLYIIYNKHELRISTQTLNSHFTYFPYCQKRGLLWG